MWFWSSTSILHKAHILLPFLRKFETSWFEGNILWAISYKRIFIFGGTLMFHIEVHGPINEEWLENTWLPFLTVYVPWPGIQQTWSSPSWRLMLSAICLNSLFKSISHIHVNSLLHLICKSSDIRIWLMSAKIASWNLDKQNDLRKQALKAGFYLSIRPE